MGVAVGVGVTVGTGVSVGVAVGARVGVGVGAGVAQATRIHAAINIASGFRTPIALSSLAIWRKDSRREKGCQAVGQPDGFSVGLKGRSPGGLALSARGFNPVGCRAYSLEPCVMRLIHSVACFAS